MITSVISLNGAGKSLTYQIDLDVTDFRIERDDEDRLSISSDCHTLGFGDDTTQPALPFKGIAVALPADTRYISCSYIPTSRTIVGSDVYVLPNPRIIPIGSSEINDSVPLPDYEGKCFPDIQLAHSYDIYTDNLTIAYFSYCPFEYNAESRELSFIDNGELTVTYAEGLDDNCIKTRIFPEDEQYYAQSVIGYPENVACTASNSAIYDCVNIEPISDVEYLVITNESLKESFQQLADWKTVKGVPTEVVTVEEIYGNASHIDGPLMIKKYLRNRYQNSRRLRYVLLGGDDTVVPVRYCYGEVSGQPTNSLVTDLYYACLSGEYDWDYNGNGIYGEPGDSVNLSIQLNISRLPVRTEQHVKGYVNKLLKYEGPKPPLKITDKADLEKKNFLMCGSRLVRPVRSDVMIQALTSSIDSIWDGDIVSLSNENIRKGEPYELTNDILNNQLQYGYRFMNMFSHGIQTGWELGNGEVYSADLASNYKSTSNTLISTIACYTNAFDCRLFADEQEVSFKSDPCLSEAFIRNPNNGVIAYLGASNEGLAMSDKFDVGGLGISANYEIQFYKTLFGNHNSYNNYAKVVAASKNNRLGTNYTGNNISNHSRWVHYCLNPVGDAEVPIFTDVPKNQNEPIVSLNGSTLSVATDSQDGRVALSGAHDYGRQYFGVSKIGSVSFSSFDKSKDAYLCISRPGYRPLLYYYGLVKSKEGTNYKFIKCDSFPFSESKIQPTGKIISCEHDGEKLAVTTSVSEDFQNVEVRSLTSDGSITDRTSVNTGDENETVRIYVRNGVNVISLVADGKILDSVTVIR